MMYLPSLLDQYPQSDPKLHSPPPQLPTVSHQIPSFSFLWIMRIAWICRYYQGKCFASLFWWHLKLHFPVRFTRWSRVLLFWVQFQWCINIPSKLPYSLDRCVVAFVGIYVNVKGKDMITNRLQSIYENLLHLAAGKIKSHELFLVFRRILWPWLCFWLVYLRWKRELCRWDLRIIHLHFTFLISNKSKLFISIEFR